MGKYQQRPRPDQDLVMQPQIIILPQGWTEYYYFKSFENQLISVAVVKPQPGLDDLLDKAVKERQEQNSRRPNNRQQIGDSVWIVVDRDFDRNNPGKDKSFNDARTRAQNEYVNVAYSDDAFELWFLLHYQDVFEPILAAEVISKLKKYYPNYSKPAEEMHKQLQDLGGSDQAIARAKRMLQRAQAQYSGNQTINPSTTVHILVDKIINSH